MHARGWSSYAVAVALLAIQVGVSALGTISLCVDRPHTHGGVPAPDCLMHDPQPVGTAPEASPHSHHHQPGDNTSTDSARLACSCSSDPLTLMTTEIAVVPNTVSIGLPNLAASSLPERAQSPIDGRRAPLSPPPRPALS